MNYQDYGNYRRRYPRRAFRRSIGVLSGGRFEIAECEEIGEGGLSFVCPYELAVDRQVVVNFRIPGGAFVSLRASIRSSRNVGHGYLHGVSFTDIEFSYKRQIRGFVSERTDKEAVRFS